MQQQQIDLVGLAVQKKLVPVQYKNLGFQHPGEPCLGVDLVGLVEESVNLS